MKKVFVSYKYADKNVRAIPRSLPFGYTTARDYVDELVKKAQGANTMIYKGEMNGEDLSDFKEDTIWNKLKERIYDSSVTVVFISPNMYDKTLRQDDQWIPWEVQYSLRDKTRNGRTSHNNALLYVVLPDYLGNYYYRSIMPSFNIIEANKKNDYAFEVRWDDFILDVDTYIKVAELHKNRVPNWKIVKTI